MKKKKYKCDCHYYSYQVCDICQGVKTKKQSLTMIIRDKLRETFDWYVDPNHIPTDKQLYYEAIRIKKAIDKGNKND